MSLVSRTIFAASVCLGLIVPASAGGLTVTALDHSGFLFSDGKTRILADALIEPSSQWPYKAPAADTLTKLEKGDKPFDGITLLLISHDHEDHYSAPSTVRFLKAHPKALVVTTPEVLRRLKTIEGFAKVEKQVVAPDIAWKHAIKQSFKGVTIELDRLKHGDDKQWACELDAFVFTLGGKKVLFAPATSGFFPEEYRELGYATRGFDLAFINFYMAIKPSRGPTPASVNAEGVALLKTLIPAKTTILMHIDAKHVADVDAVMPQVEKQLPGATVFKTEMETRTY